ncbi:MAG: hypothetical protein AB8B50_04310 [Pirellulaceae bacterium]
MLQPSSLTADNFRSHQPTQETGDLGYWINRFLTVEEEIEQAYALVTPLVEAQSGMKVMADNSWIEAQELLSANELCGIWQTLADNS